MVRFARYALAVPLALIGAYPSMAGTDPTGKTMLGAIANAEDIIAAPAREWVVVSSMAGGGQTAGALYVVDAPDAQVVRRVYPSPEPLSEPAPESSPSREAAATLEADQAITESLALDADCHEPVSPAVFAPHGINLQQHANGALTLYVVNHGGRESVEVFAVRDGRRPHLNWTGCIPLPEGTQANSVAVTPAGNLFVTVAFSTALPQGESDKTFLQGAVLTWDAARGWREVPGSRIQAPNGIVVSDDAQHIYVASWAEGRIYRIPADGADGKEQKRSVPLKFLPDNLRWAPGGRILAAGQDAPMQSVVACFVSSAPACELASAWAVIEPDSMRAQCERLLPAGKPFGSATVATAVGRELWLGSFRGSGIERLPLTGIGDPIDLCE